MTHFVVYLKDYPPNGSLPLTFNGECTFMTEWGVNNDMITFSRYSGGDILATIPKDNILLIKGED